MVGQPSASKMIGEKSSPFEQYHPARCLRISSRDRKPPEAHKDITACLLASNLVNMNALQYALLINDRGIRAQITFLNESHNEN